MFNDLKKWWKEHSKERIGIIFAGVLALLLMVLFCYEIGYAIGKFIAYITN